MIKSFFVHLLIGLGFLINLVPSHVCAMNKKKENFVNHHLAMYKTQQIKTSRPLNEQGAKTCYENLFDNGARVKITCILGGLFGTTIVLVNSAIITLFFAPGIVFLLYVLLHLILHFNKEKLSAQFKKIKNYLPECLKNKSCHCLKYVFLKIFDLDIEEPQRIEYLNSKKDALLLLCWLLLLMGVFTFDVVVNTILFILCCKYFYIAHCNEKRMSLTSTTCPFYIT